MPDSNAPKPHPADDDESIDLGNLQPVEEGASAPSFSGKGGSLSGGSSSGIRSWNEIVRGSGSGVEADDSVRYDQAPNAEDKDAVSDKDLLREVLASEPPPSKIVMKDPSAEMRALPSQPRPTSDPERALDEISTAQSASADHGVHNGPKSAPFELPPELTATRPGDSSILGHDLPVMPGQSGFTSDVWGSSSNVDFMRPGLPFDISSGSMERTEEVDRPPMLGRPRGDSSFTRLGDHLDEGDDSSAVDLGSQPAIDLPFPLGVDSSAGSAVFGSPRNPPSADSTGDSGHVDLLTPSREFDVNLPESNTTPSWAAAREDLPPTVPMVPAGKAQFAAWAGGGAGGLIAGVTLCAGLWMAGVVPNQSPKPNVPQIAGPSSKELDDAKTQVQEAAQQRDAQMAAAQTRPPKRPRPRPIWRRQAAT